MSMPLPPELKAGQAAVYLLHGEASFLTQELAQSIRHAVMQGGLEDFNLDRFDARDRPDPERIAQAARTLPMMSSRRLVWVKNASTLANLGAKSLSPLLEYIAQPDATTCLLLSAFDKVKGTTSLYKACKKHGIVHESRAPRDRELPAFLRQRAQSYGRSLRPDAAAMLMEATGNDLGAINAALERLNLYAQPGEALTVQHVEQVVPHTRTRTIWELMDALANRQPSTALAHAQALAEQGEAPLKLLGMVARQYRQLLIGRSVRAGGGSAQAAAAQAGVPPFRSDTFARQIDRYQGEELLVALERLAEADRALKRSKLPHEIIFQALILNLCAA